MTVAQALEAGGSPVQAEMRTYFTVIWSVETVLDEFGQQWFTLTLPKLVQNYPFLKDANFRLTPLIYVNLAKPPVTKKKKLSRVEQAVTYRKLLDSGKVKSRAELARKFGVSRAWVTKVLRAN